MVNTCVYTHAHSMRMHMLWCTVHMHTCVQGDSVGTYKTCAYSGLLMDLRTWFRTDVWLESIHEEGVRVAEATAGHLWGRAESGAHWAGQYLGLRSRGSQCLLAKCIFS